MACVDMRKHPIYKYLFVDDEDKRVVYRFRFAADGAEYYGISKKKRVMVRQYDHHSGTLATNVVLTNRLQKGKPPKFEVLSCHSSEKSARRAEASCIAASKKVINKGSSSSNSIYAKEKSAEKITKARLRKSPEGPNEKHVVYRYRFKDGATYCGSAAEVRVGFRCYEHRWTTRGNVVLHARLQNEKNYELCIMSKHRDKESALQAEDDCIRQSAKTINAKGAKRGGPLPNSIYKKEKRAKGLDRKPRAKRLRKTKGAK